MHRTARCASVNGRKVICAVRHLNGYGLAGLTGAVAFAASLVLLQGARTGIDWTEHYVSDFVNGRFGVLFVVGAAVHGLGNLILGEGLRRSLAPSFLRSGAVLLFGLAASGILLAALFPTDPGGQAQTLAGLVHRVASAASFPLELVALFLFSAAFAVSPLWQRPAGWSFAWSMIASVAVIGLALAVWWKRVPGLAERLALATFLMWEIAVSVALLRIGTVGQPAGAISMESFHSAQDATGASSEVRLGDEQAGRVRP